MAIYLELNAERQVRAATLGKPYIFSDDEIRAFQKGLENRGLFEKSWNYYLANFDLTASERGLHMCGEIDEQSRFDEELFDRFLELAARHGVVPGTPDSDAPTQLTEPGVRVAYMDRLFKAGLTRALNDATNLPQGERMDVLAGQAIIFSRLAGFLAGQFPAEADLFQTVVGTLVKSHNEPAGIV